MPEYVPSIATLRERAAQLIGRQVGRGELKSMLAAICAAKNAGTPIPPDSTGQTWITESQGIINQADQDALAILVREFAEFVENAGGGGGGDAPAVIAPFPGIGAEGEYYSQQVRTTGATPQTFQVTLGSLPVGMSLNQASGIISGTCEYPFGGLYAGIITVSNEAGTTDYTYSILISGTEPTFAQDWTYPIALLGAGFSGMTGGQSYFNTYAGDFTATSSGVYPDSAVGSVPATWEFISVQGPPLPDGVSFDSNTGNTTGSPTNPDQLCKLYQYGVGYRNYFGYHQEDYTMSIVPTIYWGEWHGALPGSFTAANIQTDLFNNATPGPRIIPGDNGVGTSVAFAGAISCNASGPGFFRFPAVSPARARVLAIPRLWFTGDVNQGITSWGATATFTPPFPTPYQEDLVLTVNGIDIPYDVYVIPSTASQVDLFFTANAPPSMRTSDDSLQFLMYAGDANFRPRGSENNSTDTVQLEISSALPITYSTEGSLPTGVVWDELSQTITGTPTNPDDVFEQFNFSVIATNSNGSNRLNLVFVVSAPVYWGELPGSLPATFSSSDITSGLLSNGSPGPLMLPAGPVPGAPPGTYTMSASATGFCGTIIPSFYANSSDASAYYPAIFYFYSFGRVYLPGVTAPPLRIVAVPTKFFTGSWPQDPYGQGTTTRYDLAEGYGSPKPILIPPVAPGQSMNDATPYQSDLVIITNGVSVKYNIYVVQSSWGLGYTIPLKFTPTYS